MRHQAVFRAVRSPQAPLSILAIAVFACALAMFVSVQPAGAATLVVGNGGYPTINAAIQAASSGDTVSVHAGAYSEQVNVSKRLTLKAFGDGPVWVDGNCSRTYGISISADGASIDGLSVKRSDEGGVRVYYADDVTLNDLTIQDYNCANVNAQYSAGVAVWDSSGLALTGSRIIRRVDLSGSPHGTGNGVWIKNTSVTTGGGHYIADNTIIGGYDGIGGEPEDVVHGSFYRDSTIENNTVADCWDDGIQVEGGGINTVVRGNRVEGCAIGIAFAPVLVGPLYIQQNTIVDLVPGYYGSTYAFKIGDSSQGITYLEDNVVSTSGDALKESNPGVGPIVSRRNVINVSRYVVEISSGIPAGMSFDYDCFWTSDSSRFIKWGGSTYGSMSAFRSATGHEVHGTESPDCEASPTPSPAPTASPSPPPPTASPTPSPSTTPAPTPSPTPPPAVDSDGDGLPNSVELACGSDPAKSSSIPEMIGGPFSGSDDDGDTLTDERIFGAGSADCDGDGFSADVEAHLYDSSNRVDQDGCGTASASPPYTQPIGWPADLSSGGSANRLNIFDLASFVAPVRHLGDDLTPENRRWDLAPGPGSLSSDINIIDLAMVVTIRPRMMDGERAFNGPPCPWP